MNTHSAASIGWRGQASFIILARKHGPAYKLHTLNHKYSYVHDEFALDAKPYRLDLGHAVIPFSDGIPFSCSHESMKCAPLHFREPAATLIKALLPSPISSFYSSCRARFSHFWPPDISHNPSYYRVALLVRHHTFTERHPDYPLSPTAMERGSRMIDVPDHRQSNGDQNEHRSSPSRNESQKDADAPLADDVDQALEDAQLVLGRNIAFSIVPKDDAFDAQEVVERLSNSSTDSSASVEATVTICIPVNKVTHFHEVLRECLVQRSQMVVERAGRMAFWRGKEPYIRPVLSRSLSLP